MCRVEQGIGYSPINKGRWVKKGHIVSIAVIPEARRKGIGTALMLHVMKTLKEDYNVDEYYLEVRVSNIAAIRLYEKLGFKRIKVIKGYYLNGEDAYLMAKSAKD